MANYFVSYDLNGKNPTHAEMDKHLKKLGKCVLRVLETVWYVRTTKTQSELFDYAGSILTQNDRLLVVSASNCEWHNLLVSDAELQNCWEN